MDILKSSNIERILYDMFGAKRTKEFMDSLAKKNKFTLDADELATLQESFAASYSNDAQCAEVIAKYAKRGYLMDTHTATCLKSYESLKEHPLKTVLYSTAEWTKFSTSVLKALGGSKTDDIQALKEISIAQKVSVPSMIEALFSKEVCHSTIVDKSQIQKEIEAFL